MMEVFDGPIEQAPMEYVPRAEQRRMLADALSGLELGSWDQVILTWMAGWDASTAVTVASWLVRVRGLDGTVPP